MEKFGDLTGPPPLKDHGGSGPKLQDPLVAQRNPFEVALLLWGSFVGIAYLTGHPLSGTVQTELDTFAAALWAWTIAVGCLSGCVGLALRGRAIEVGFVLERFAMILMVGGMFVYALVILAKIGFSEGGQVAVQNLIFALACVIRAWQITRRLRWQRQQYNHRNDETERP